MDSQKVESYIFHELKLYGKFAEHGAHVIGVDGYRTSKNIDKGNSRQRSVNASSSYYRSSMKRQTMKAVYIDWSEGDSRQQANAEEVIDQTLQGSLRTEMANSWRARADRA